MKKTKITPIVLALALVPLASASHLGAAQVEVDIRDNFFDPSAITICLGDTVHWTHVGNLVHTTTSGSGCGSNGIWDSGFMTNGDTFSQTFNSVPAQCATDEDPGDNTCSYNCQVHCPAMDGVITIAEDPTGGNGIAVSKLRVPKTDSTLGKGGVEKGTTTFDGISSSDFVGPAEVTLTLRGDGGSTLDITSPTVSVPRDSRGSYINRKVPANGAFELNITKIVLRPTRDPNVMQQEVHYEVALTGGKSFDDVTNLEIEVEIIYTGGDGPCGMTDVLTTGTSPVAF